MGLADGKTEKLAGIVSSRTKLPRHSKVLVVGCGEGLEAAILTQVLGVEVFGIDTRPIFDRRFSDLPGLTLSVGDATALRFQDNSFDLVYSYHALEHIPDPGRALGEMKRVLLPGGWAMAGVPNRSRFLGYIGSKDLSLARKIRGNAGDWAARLAGRFRNEDGAHAGFTGSELAALLGRYFTSVTDISLEYYRTVYPKFAATFTVLAAIGIGRFLFPSVYFLARK